MLRRSRCVLIFFKREIIRWSEAQSSCSKTKCNSYVRYDKAICKQEPFYKRGRDAHGSAVEEAGLMYRGRNHICLQYQDGNSSNIEHARLETAVHGLPPDGGLQQ